jgi:hypothetical protein
MQRFIIIFDVEKMNSFITVKVYELLALMLLFIFYIFIYDFDSSDCRVEWLEDYRPVNTEAFRKM